MSVIPATILEVGGIIRRLMLKKVESDNMQNVKQNFLESHLLQSDHQGILKDVEVQFIDKTQASEPTKREFYLMRTRRTLYPDGLILKVT